uniref:C-type lectin domain-containing protein n=1 Tax=Stegastes partitus TaxID=144197 RepID=A0A3B5B9Z6_9TELE
MFIGHRTVTQTVDSKTATLQTNALSCPEHQEGFDGSCYEFVGLQRSFLSAQGWCEQGGGHLAFILNDEMQQFLQKHLQPETDWWLGLAPAAPNLTLDSTSTEGFKNTAC